MSYVFYGVGILAACLLAGAMVWNARREERELNRWFEERRRRMDEKL